MVEWSRSHPDSNSGNGWRKNHPVESRAYMRTSNYKRLGVTIGQYEALWTAQRGHCANQGCTAEYPMITTDYRHALQVDHDHRSGAVRGLLCPRCNTALGHIDDDAGGLAGLIEYLDRHVVESLN